MAASNPSLCGMSSEEMVQAATPAAFARERAPEFPLLLMTTTTLPECVRPRMRRECTEAWCLHERPDADLQHRADCATEAGGR